MSRLPTIPYYKVVRLIEKGGTSAIYEGIDLRSKERVAIKALFREKANNDIMLKRFREETTHYLLLSHANLPRLVDFSVHEEQMYLIMEYVDGVDMSKYLKANGPIDEEQTVKFFTVILDTIGYLHSQGILHLDIKPSNIMVTRQMGIKVLDLGISAMVSEEETERKKIGSPTFMAPEQIRCEKLTPCTDIYQIGVTLYNMVTGRLPFTGSTREEIFDHIENDTVPSLGDFPLANALQPVVDKAMQKEGKNRYQSCCEMKDALLDSLSRDIEAKQKETKTKEIINELKPMEIITVGRDRDNNIVISEDACVSRHHLQLRKDEEGKFFVCDLNSSNGTFVNGQCISGEVEIDVHDVIRIGKNTILPWVNYFRNADEATVDTDDKKRKRRRRRKTPEERQAQRKKIKEMLRNVGKWFLRILSSILMMIIMWSIMKLIWPQR